MKSFCTVLILCIYFQNTALGQTSLGKTDDQLMQEAVADTQGKMKSPTQRKELLQSKEAKKANLDASNTVGSENIDELYAITAEILPLLMEKNGDTEKAAQYLEKMKRNPAQFLQELPPDIKAKIKALSMKVEKKESARTKSYNP